MGAKLIRFIFLVLSIQYIFQAEAYSKPDSITFWSYKDGRAVGQIISRSEAEVICVGKICYRTAKNYFDSIKSASDYETYKCQLNSYVGKSVRIYEADRPLDLCEKSSTGWLEPDIYTESDVGYRLTHQTDGIHIGMKIRFSLISKHAISPPDLMLENMRMCIPFIQRFWKQYGITFDLYLSSDEDDWPADVRVHLSDENQLDGGLRRSDSGHFFYGGMKNDLAENCWNHCIKKCDYSDDCKFSCVNKCELYRQHETCLLMLHEIGHLLGLPDEYEEKSRCPDRTQTRYYQKGDPVSVMDDQSLGWDKIEFYPEHIRKVLQPLCP